MDLGVQRGVIHAVPKAQPEKAEVSKAQPERAADKAVAESVPEAEARQEEVAGGAMSEDDDVVVAARPGKRRSAGLLGLMHMV